MVGGRVFAISGSIALSACGRSAANQDATNAQGFQQGQPGQTSYAALQPTSAPAPNTPPAPAPSASNQAASGMQPLGNVSSDPAALQSIIAGALAGGAASLSALTGGELQPIQQGIKSQAATQARGMKPEGQMMSAKLQQDGHAQGTLTLEPGRCYTVIGFATFGVFKYEINLLTAPPSPPSVLAQSRSDGITPVVGPNEQCLRNPYPLPMQVKVDMHVVQGQGSVGAQAYKK
jgi:hypothetical protein